MRECCHLFVGDVSRFDGLGALAADGFAAQLRLDANRPGDDAAVGYRLTDAYVTIAVP